jgi:hypothetical protein
MPSEHRRMFERLKAWAAAMKRDVLALFADGFHLTG